MANLNKKETETMQIKINLKTYNLGDLKALALEKLRDTQENYTKKREEYIRSYISSNKKSTGHLWWKIYSDFTRDEAIEQLFISRFNSAWNIWYRNEESDCILLNVCNKIQNIDENYSESLELILTDIEYDWLMK